MREVVIEQAGIRVFFSQHAISKQIM